MKTTIITIYDPKPNYGNRLQNYAVQSVLKRFGCQVETVVFERLPISIKTVIKYHIMKLFRFKLPGNKNYWKCDLSKRFAFNSFNKKYIATKDVFALDEAKEIQTDYFVLGSDQVWNPSWYDSCPLKKDLFLLTFARPEQKVCFSPSFGVEQLPNEWESWFKEHLSTFPAISVREEAGAKIVKELTGKDATVLIDPTMMLDASQWIKIARSPKRVNCDKPYILTYFLGKRSQRIENDLQKYAKENSLEVYNLMDYGQPDVFVSDPSEFIYLIAHAKLVMTDSFHACVFSFLFDKPFLVYSREDSEGNMMSRMDTLLEKIDLKRKYVDSGLPNELLECDYSVGHRRIEAEKRKSMDFLKKSLRLE